MTAPSPVRINGWTMFAHPLFLDQLEQLVAAVERAKAKDPEGYARKNAAKRLKAVADLAFKIIPADPTRPDYIQGEALGAERRHWFRAKFFQQYVLFFRYRRDLRIIVYAWINDEDTKRAYGSASDAYRVFRRMLDRHRPPDDWDALLAEAQKETARLAGTAARLSSRPRP
jgi:toxin YhaV